MKHVSDQRLTDQCEFEATGNSEWIEASRGRTQCFAILGLASRGRSRNCLGQIEPTTSQQGEIFMVCAPRSMVSSALLESEQQLTTFASTLLLLGFSHSFSSTSRSSEYSPCLGIYSNNNTFKHALLRYNRCFGPCRHRLCPRLDFR